VSTLDFDDDGWTDLYVANDSNPSALYRNNARRHVPGRRRPIGCAFSQDGKPQAGMGVADRRLRSQRHHGRLQDQLLPATPRRSTRTRRRVSATTGPSPRGIGLNTRWLGLGHRLASTSTTTAGSIFF
jgi:hypothetical protein